MAWICSGGFAMNGTEYLLDTNAVVYLLAGNSCMRKYPGSRLAISVITVMELLSYPSLSGEDEKVIRDFIKDCTIINVSEEIVEKTIQLRRTYKNKLPDSIIAASAIVFDIPLVTADIGFSKIDELKMEQIKP